jgi:hypothetical protein
MDECKSLTRRNIQTCNLVATNATIENLNVTNPIVVPPALTCNVACTRASYFGAPDTIQHLQTGGIITSQWEILQFWTQYGRLEPFIPLLGASIFSPVLTTASLTPVPPPFGNPTRTLIQEYLDFLNDAFAQLGLASSAGLEAQPAITIRSSSPQMAIRSTTLNLTNYVFIVQRINDGVPNFTYTYAMDGAIPFMNSTLFPSQIQSGESVWAVRGPGPVNIAGQPQDAIGDLYNPLTSYYTSTPTILGFSTCGGQLATDQQMVPPASSRILLNP